jgi:hypothetical protein
MQDAQERVASKSMYKGKSSKKSLNEMVKIAFILEGAINQVDWRVVMVVTTQPPPSGKKTFIAKRECSCI